MNAEKLKIPYPIIVEGKYDRAAVESVADATVITTGGFAIFSKDEQISLLRRLARECGIIILTDSDGAGKVIRSHISSMIPDGKIFNLYIPAVPGKEKRKSEPSKAGLLGVEGMGGELLRQILAPFASDSAARDTGRQLTKADLYADGFSGGEGSAARRASLAVSLGLPGDMSPNALVQAINLICGYDGYAAARDSLSGNSEDNGKESKEEMTI